MCEVKIWLLLVLAIGVVACAKPDPVEAAFQKCTKSITDNIKSLENQPEAIKSVANGIAGMGLKVCDLIDRKSTRLNSSHLRLSRMPSSA